ncbi:hypothetical protein AC230_20205 [Streptomyces caatingaensis]|uniref:Uncharacterized protein n=2 Tax=Streptomyces caatingaensis TaxID=1678637 RepID=A0A0K9XDR3_9ACTN|nr:hypothetical protein AC230_20205 [Streptomyces caatingaensis]
MVALLEGGASGCDLAEQFGAPVAGFWTAGPQRIHRGLERMEDEDLAAEPGKRLFPRPGLSLFPYRLVLA